MTSSRRLYVSDAGKIVEESDTTAAFLLVGEGCEVELEALQRYGLSVEDVAKALEPEADKSSNPSANKSLKPSAKK